MKKTIYTILWVVLSLVFGSLINGLIINIAPLIIKYPAGVSFATEASTIQSMKLLEPIHLMIPFLAHAIGTFISTFLMSIYIKKPYLKIAFIISLLYLVAGIYMVFLIPAPLWFDILDLTLAYIPMGYLGAKLGVKINVFKRNN
jgi:hypothetical protein